MEVIHSALPQVGQFLLHTPQARRQELSQLYGELYQGDSAALDDFLEMLRRCWRERKRALRDQDRRREADPG